MAESTGGRVGEGIKTTAAAAQERAREQFASTREVIRHSATDAVEQARLAMRDAAEQQKHRAADGITGFARSLHQMARNLENEQQASAAHYTHLVADQLERSARQLDARSADQMLDDVEAFARRQPAAFIGGAFAAGFLLARFLKSTRGMSGFESGATGTAHAAGLRPSGQAGYGAAAAPGSYAEYEPVRTTPSAAGIGTAGATGPTATPGAGGAAATTAAGSGAAPPKTGPGTPFTGSPAEGRRES